jgi:hypothetical protein
MENIYKLYNPLTEATIRCTTKYLRVWLARGFVVDQIVVDISSENIQEMLEGGNHNGTQLSTSANI